MHSSSSGLLPTADFHMRPAQSSRKDFFPPAVLPVRRLGGIFPLRGSAHKKVQKKSSAP
jgi:hypothetical protein